MTELLLFTTNHPFTFSGGETMFVGPELPHLVRAFDAVRVVPLHDAGDCLPLPAAAVLDRTLARRWRRRRAWHYLEAPRWPGFWPELARGARHGGWVGAARVWRWAAVAAATWAWLRAQPPQDGPTLLYSYWRGGQTLAAARWAAAARHRVAVTRVHGYDLYAHAFAPPFQPWASVYARLGRVVAIAQHGVDHLRALGVAAPQLLLARLGVPAAARRASASTDGVLRLVSCSSVTALKRVDRIADALLELARRWPQQRFEWTHFGAGPALPDVRRRLRQAPPNLRCTLPGRVDNAAVRAHYASQAVDLFMLLSRSEGLPVSIQEALAAGIPVLATAVGGVAEAVNADIGDGALVAGDATTAQIVAALEGLLFEADAQRRAQRRDAAWRHWAREFDAARNHARLAGQLRAMLD